MVHTSLPDKRHTANTKAAHNTTEVACRLCRQSAADVRTNQAVSVVMPHLLLAFIHLVLGQMNIHADLATAVGAVTAGCAAKAMV